MLSCAASTAARSTSQDTSNGHNRLNTPACRHAWPCCTAPERSTSARGAHLREVPVPGVHAVQEGPFVADVEGEEVERSDHKLAVMPAVKPHRESNCDEAGGREGDQNQERGRPRDALQRLGLAQELINDVHAVAVKQQQGRRRSKGPPERSLHHNSVN